MAQGIKKGDVLKGRYEIQRLIGKGGMSRVFMAVDLQLNNKLWAVKEVDRHAKDPAGRPIEQALAKEAQILSRLDHPKIVSIVDTETTADFIYVVMDFVEGESLDKIVRREGPQTEENVQRWMLEICDVLGYLHAQDPPIVYRDMKPNNIMLHPDGYVKLIDFGVVREYKDADDVKQDTIAFGTQGYAPPEQYGQAQTDARADIYAVGATMWHLLAGEAPPMEFPLRDVRDKNPEVSEGFAEHIIPKCTALERTERYQCCDDLAADLEIYEELTQDYRQVQVRKVRSFALSAIAAVVLFVAGFGLLAARSAAITSTYESLLGQAAGLVQSDTSTAEQNYIDAIQAYPEGIDAYLGLIACYKVDGAFDEAEKKQFDSVYQSNLDVLKDASRFAELSYAIGQLYWTYYTYGQTEGSGDFDENQASRIKASAEYFSNAAADANFDNHDNAQLFNDIAQFTVNISNLQREGSDDAALYSGYWENLTNLASKLSTVENDMLKVDCAALVANSIETYLDKFRNVADVSQAEVEAVIREVHQGIRNEIRGNADLEQKRLSILDRLSKEVATKVTTVYSDADVTSR